MLYSVDLVLLGWVAGFVVVASNPSPYFAALGLVFVVGVGGVYLLMCGAMYFCFILMLVYLGGMLVVFAFTAAMAADPHPETLGWSGVLNLVVTYSMGCLVGGYFLWGGNKGLVNNMTREGDKLNMLRGDIEGVASMYSKGGWSLVMCAWGLLVSLFVVMEVIRGSSRGALRAV